jgi:hypothetical protein
MPNAYSRLPGHGTLTGKQITPTPVAFSGSGALSGVRTAPITVFTLNGTGYGGPAGSLTTTGTGFAAYVGANLNSKLYAWYPLSYPAALPFSLSYQQGVQTLAGKINELPIGARYVLVGYDQGAMIASQVYNSVTQGLVGVGRQLVAGVTFGSPMRQYGHTFPNDTSNAGGTGIMGAQYLMTSAPTLWWDFAIPTDVFACGGASPGTAISSVATDIFMTLYTSWTGALNTLLTLIDEFSSWTSLVWAIAGLMQGNVPTTVPHGQYGTYQPISSTTCVALAIKYLNGIGLLQGTGTLSGAHGYKSSLLVNLPGSGQLSGSGKPIQKRPAALSGAGRLTALDETYHRTATANLTGAGVLQGTE